jgi:hypothetical protein
VNKSDVSADLGFLVNRKKIEVDKFWKKFFTSLQLYLKLFTDVIFKTDKQRKCKDGGKMGT